MTRTAKGEVSTRVLPCGLSFEDRQNRARELADVVLAYKRDEEAEKARSKLVKDALKDLRARWETLADSLVSGKEDRPVACVEEHTKTMRRIVRCDTGEVIEEHPLKQLDLLSLPDVEANDDEAKH